MEGDLQFEKSDQSTMKICERNPIGTTNSEMSSSPNSKSLVEGDDVTTLVADSMSMDWTNEKHSLFLNAMEASFVKQLYNHKSCSTDSLPWHTRIEVLDSKSSRRQLNANEQFKGFQSGCWEKIKFERPQSQPDIVPRSHILVENQWVRCFKSTVDHEDVRLQNLQGNGAQSSTEAIHSVGLKAAAPFGVLKSSKKFPACHLRPCHDDSVILDFEVTDQNFVDENQKRDHSSSWCRAKRMKT